MNIIEACQLKVGFGKAPIVYVPKLDLEKGSLVPLIGPNGSGKTSLLLTFAQLMSPVGGQLKLFGLSKQDIVFLPHQPTFFSKLTTGEHLELVATIEGRRLNPDPVLKAFDLLPFKNCPSSQLSAGQRKCLSFACLAVKQPSLILLDEPGSDLDSAHRQLMHRAMYDLCQKGSTCLFSTHQAEDVILYNRTLKIESKILSWHNIKTQTTKDRHESFSTSEV